MEFHRASNNAAAVEIRATASRFDRTAEVVTITELRFESCRIRSDAVFEIGERLRLHLPGQGWIEVEVQWISGEEVHLGFVVDCTV
jgi:hypothetical protein